LDVIDVVPKYYSYIIENFWPFDYSDRSRINNNLRKQYASRWPIVKYRFFGNFFFLEKTIAVDQRTRTERE
jgi:hypothetical protein